MFTRDEITFAKAQDGKDANRLDTSPVSPTLSPYVVRTIEAKLHLDLHLCTRSCYVVKCEMRRSPLFTVTMNQSTYSRG